MKRNFLVPLDGSKESEAILPEVMRIASPRDHIHLLHVVPAVHAPVGLDPTYVLDLQEQAARILRIARERWIPDQGGLDLVPSGDAAEGILAAALEMNINLIAMTTRGRGGLGRLLLGSVAAEVVRRAQLPVLLARPDQPRSSKAIRRILVSLEGGETPRDLLESVKSVAAGSPAEIVLFHAAAPVNDPAPQWAFSPALSAHSGPQHRLQWLADILEEEGYVAWPLVSVGNPVEEILSQARKLEVDLIALSTHARSGLERLLEGSVAEGVLRESPVAILLQKPLVIYKAALVGGAHA